MCNLKIISKHNDFTFELFGVISSDGKSATIDGSSGVFMLEWVTEKEAEIIGKLNPLTLMVGGGSKCLHFFQVAISP